MKTHDKIVKCRSCGYIGPCEPTCCERPDYDGATAEEAWHAAIEVDRQANQITGETSDGYHTFNELYAHRVRLFCVLMHSHKCSAWWSRKHHDGSAWEGWVIAGIDTPEGSITYHLPESEIENLPEGTELSNGKEWDGHTAADVLVRLLSLRQVRGEPETEREKWLTSLSPEDRMFEEIDQMARESYKRHMSLKRGQMVVRADAWESHVVWATKRWIEANEPDPMQIPEPSILRESMSSNHRSYADGWNACRKAMLEAAPEVKK